MGASWQSITIQPGYATIVVDAGDGMTMLTNTDPSNTVWLGDYNGLQPGAGNAVALPPLASLVISGIETVYATVTAGQEAIVSVIPGGVSFFQFVKIIAKIIEISGASGNGLFVYSGSPGFGDLVAAITAEAGPDPYGNSAPAGISLSGLPLLVYSGTPALGNLIASIAPVAGSDNVGNSYPQGFSITIGQISGTQFVADGNSGDILVYASKPATSQTVPFVAGHGGVSSGTSTTVNITTPVPAGSTVILALDFGVLTAGIAVTDTQGNLYNLIKDELGGGVLYVYSAENVTALGITDSISITWTGSTTLNALVAACPTSGLNDIAVLNGVSSATSVSVATGAMNYPNELILAFAAVGGAPAITWSNVTQFGSQTAFGGNGLTAAYAIPPNKTSVTVGASWTGNENAGLIVVTFALYAPLVLAISGAASNDQYGNTYPQGLKVTGSGGSAISVIPSATGFSEIKFQTGRTAEKSGSALISNVGNLQAANEYLSLTMLGPQVTGSKEQVAVFLNSEAENSSFDAGGSLVYVDSSGNGHGYLVWGSSGIQVQSTFSGDTNLYETERLTQVDANDVTINNSTPHQFFGSVPLGVGTYRIHGQLVCEPTVSGGTIEVEITGASLSLSALGITYTEIVIGTPGTLGNTEYVTAQNVIFATTTVGAGLGSRLITFDGTVVVTGSGTIGIFAQTNGTGTFKIMAAGSWWEFLPVGG